MSERAAVVGCCPACNATATPQVGRTARGFDTVAGGRSFYQPDYEVRECSACGLYFKSPQLTAAELDAYYAVRESAVFDYDGNFPTDGVVRGLLLALPDGSRVLDFGCSTGRILKEHTRRLVCAGVEPNVTAAATARSRGIDVIVPERVAGAGPFDAILLTDVFEHLAAPMPVLRMLVSRLKPGGWLAIVTGNADAIATRTRLAEFWYFRMPEHLIMMSERHVQWLATQFGLQIAAVHRCSHYRLSVITRLRQFVQAFAYEQFQSARGGAIARVLVRLPRIAAARDWKTEPAITYRNDHLVAVLTRPAS
ncbi:MAG TPA: methyltransferase domain-containing protein [Vicinamibacterales bacterium]|nr:methyltransferase domain-containing protein [Vicinamibacterales bacterium]